MTWQVCDATNMPEFEDCSFDLVIDKGTYDALACDKQERVDEKLMKEMMRVTKINGYLIEISNGTVEKRLDVFKAYDEEGNFEITYEQITLSPLAQAINVLRSQSKSSLKEAIKDPELLKYALLKMTEGNIITALCI